MIFWTALALSNARCRCTKYYKYSQILPKHHTWLKIQNSITIIRSYLFGISKFVSTFYICKMPISNCAKCLLLPVTIILLCPKCALVWENCCERLREFFVRVLRSSRVNLIMSIIQMCSVVSESKVLLFCYCCSSQFCVTKAALVTKCTF